MKSTATFAVIATLAAAASAQLEETVRGDLGSALDAVYIDAAEEGFSGIVLIAREGEILLLKGYGLANRETNTPWTPATVSDIGSITKPFTALAVLKLASEVRLHVDDRIGQYFNGVPSDKRHITVHHLLTHSSGLRSDFGGDFDADATRPVIFRRAMQSDLLWGTEGAGTRYEYSNTGYSVLAMIVEEVARKPYEEYLREAVLEPAGMHDTGYTLAWDPARFAQGYYEDKHWGVVAEKHALPDGPAWPLRGNGGLHTTITDMYAFHRAFVENKILPAEWKEKMLAPHVREHPTQPFFYGYGFALEDLPREGKSYGHNGGNGSFFADFRHYFEPETTFITMSNVAERPAEQYNDKIRRILFPLD
ncbi:MAG: serine hydrolase domain-containing protein [Candidatus Hydrogenedentales bacterium]